MHVFIFIVNNIMQFTKKLLKCRAGVRSCNSFMLRAVTSPSSFKKIRGHVGCAVKKKKDKLHSCTGIEALYRPCGP